MAKIKKTFDRELMYKKIMPSNMKKDEIEQNDTNELVETIAENNNSTEAIFQNKELNLLRDEKNEVILYNVTEKLVLNKLDATLKKMNCCRCDRCKEDIVAIALNNLKPKYVVANKDNIKEKIHKFNEIGSEVTTEVIKAVLTVRKNPRH